MKCVLSKFLCLRGHSGRIVMDQVWSEVSGKNYSKRPNQYNEKTGGTENRQTFLTAIL